METGDKWQWRRPPARGLLREPSALKWANNDTVIIKGTHYASQMNTAVDVDVPCELDVVLCVFRVGPTYSISVWYSVHCFCDWYTSQPQR